MALTARIKKRYGDFRLDVAFTADDGERLALLGPSGCGKSVTLKCLAGIHRPDEGRIELDGRVLFDSEKRIDLPPRKRRVGYLFQQYALFPNMTVEQNIAVGIRDKARRREEVPRLIRLLRLEGQEGKRPGQLSGGQQQRVALGRILASRPAAILLDEPFSALDSHLKWQLELELKDLLAQFPGPVIWVSHDLGEVWRGCARVCALDGGRGSPVMEMGRLLTDPVTVSAARLSGCRNYVPVSPGPGPGMIQVPAWDGAVLLCAAPWRPKAAVLAIRAEHILPAGPEAENALLCRVERVEEDVDGLLVMLRPRGADGTLWMWAEKARRAELAPGNEIWAALPPERLMLLEE